MLTGKETRIWSQYHQVKPGGDIAVILGICKLCSRPMTPRRRAENECWTLVSSNSTQVALRRSKPRFGRLGGA